MATRIIDETGHRYGRLVVLERYPTDRSDVYWKCRCDCGMEIAVRGSNLRYGRTRSCGCLRREINHANMARFWAAAREKEVHL